MRQHRPGLWLVFGALAAAVGAAMLVSGLRAFGLPQDLDRVAGCEVDFSSGCVTSRSATVVDQGYVRRGWISGDQKWWLRPEGFVPGETSRFRIDVTLPRQPGRHALHPGTALRLVFYGSKAATLVLPDGTRLETEDHPTYYAPRTTLLGLAALSAGLWAALWGLSERGRGSMFRKSDSRPTPNIAFIPTIASFTALPVSWFVGPRNPLVLVAFLAGLGFGVRASRRLRRSVTGKHARES